METTAIEALVIPGTFVPGILAEPCYRHFRRLFDCPTHIEPIPRLGLGDPLQSLMEIWSKYFYRFPEKKYYLVGHSQGGVLAVLLGVTCPKQVEKVFTFGAPFHGTLLTEPATLPLRAIKQLVWVASHGRYHLNIPVPEVVLPFPAAKALARKSTLMQFLAEVLNSREENSPELISFYSPFDSFVLPTRSSFLEGRGVTNYFVAPQKYYQRIKEHLPPGTRHIDAFTEHLTQIYCPKIMQEMRHIVSVENKSVVMLDTASKAS